MESAYKSYSHIDGLDRIDSILDESDTSFPEVDEIPTRDKLTYTNGFYVNCTALFVDIRGSSRLPQVHKRPTLAKLYRAYISELVAVMNDNAQCREIRIVGDCVSGIFNTPQKWQIDAAFETAFTISSIIDVLNYKLKKKNIEQITIGIGMDYGRALMVKAGYKGSGINDVVWMGDVVNKASNLCGYGNKNWNDYEIMLSQVVYSNLNDYNKGLLSWNSNRGCYHGNVISKSIQEWLDQQKSSPNNNFNNRTNYRLY